MFAILAVICAVFAAFKFEPFDKIEMLPLAVAFLALAYLVGNWPIGTIVRRD